MKRLTFIFFLIITLISCKDDLVNGDEKVLEFKTETELKSGNLFSNSELSIQLDSVTSDSRCPINADCIWEGNASVRFIVTISENEHIITLNTNGGNKYPSDTILQQFSITLTSLAPSPEIGFEISQEDYVATLIVNELND